MNVENLAGILFNALIHNPRQFDQPWFVPYDVKCLLIIMSVHDIQDDNFQFYIECYKLQNLYNLLAPIYTVYLN